SGAFAVVEGTGDHGCEYMTGGVVVVLGRTGRNFAAGMSGGVAFVLDEDERFFTRVNRGHGSIQMKKVEDAEDISTLKSLIEAHYTYTGSERAKEILTGWDEALPKLVKVISREYEQMLAELGREQAVEQAEAVAV